MPRYRCYVLDKQGRIASGTDITAEDDASALTSAAASVRTSELHPTLRGLQHILLGPSGSSAVHPVHRNNREPHCMRFAMDSILAAAIEHIRLMDRRIAGQKLAIERLGIEQRDTSAAMRRLALLNAALQEMRVQLAQLTPSEHQLSAPVWALPLLMAPDVDEPTRNAAA
jgi:hypothetical protein